MITSAIFLPALCEPRNLVAAMPVDAWANRERFSLRVCLVAVER